MRAIVQDEYGEPKEVLKLADVDEPEIKDDEVLVRVRAASIAAGDLLMMRGVPYIMRPGVFGLRKPKSRVPGLDMAGVVEAVGSKVKQFRPGDEVFGEGTGALAEYGVARDTALALKPEGVTMEQAAAVPVSGTTALQALRDVGKVQPGQTVLINGASGGVGTYAVQIAKSMGAEVTGVCSTTKVDMIRSIGADHVIDYTEEDFTQRDQRYDVILDNAANHSLSDLMGMLTPEGMLIPNNGTGGGRWFGPLGRIFKAFAMSKLGRQHLTILVAKANTEDLGALGELIESGQVAPVIDRTCELAEAPDAAAYVAEGHARGKVVVTV